MAATLWKRVETVEEWVRVVPHIIPLSREPWIHWTSRNRCESFTATCHDCRETFHFGPRLSKWSSESLSTCKNQGVGHLDAPEALKDTGQKKNFKGRSGGPTDQHHIINCSRGTPLVSIDGPVDRSLNCRCKTFTKKRNWPTHSFLNEIEGFFLLAWLFGAGMKNV